MMVALAVVSVLFAAFIYCLFRLMADGHWPWDAL